MSVPRFTGRPVSQTGKRSSRAPSVASRLWKTSRWQLGVALEFLLMLGFWQLIAQLEVMPRQFLPSPLDVWDALVELVAAGTLPGHTLFTLQNFFVGFLLAFLVGIPVGMAMGGSQLAEMFLAPPMWALYAVPRIALAPIFIIALGLGAASKIAVVFTMATFPILINTMQGMKSVPTTLLNVASVYGASRMEMVRKIILPSLLPYIFVGLRIAVAGAIAGALVGEFIGSFEGLGLLLSRAAFNFNLARALALVIIIVILAQGLMTIVQIGKRVFAPWDTEIKG